MSRVRAGDRISNYILEHPLGTGSFGEVWRARHHAFGTVVAIKIPTEQQYVRNLQREGLAVHGVHHPNIVRVIDLDHYADPPYLVMEFVDGPSLREAIDASRGQFPIAAVFSVMHGLLGALSAAHRAGLIHRDIKPSNILLNHPLSELESLPETAVRVADFGLGRVGGDVAQSMMHSGSLLTSEGRSIAGTIAYMSPEQREGHDVDARSDLYSCGIVLYEMITGERPQGTHLPSQIRGGVPAVLDQVFQRSYARLDRRYGSADEMLVVLGAAPAKVADASKSAPPVALIPPPSAARVPPREPRPEPPKVVMASMAEVAPAPVRPVVPDAPPTVLKAPPEAADSPAREHLWLSWVLPAILLVAVVLISISIIGDTERQHRTTQATPPQPSRIARSDTPAEPRARDKNLKLDLGAGVTMDFVLVPAGEFMMGSPDSDLDRFSDEGPQRRVTISSPFYLGKCEVTQAQWRTVMGGNPSSFADGPNFPVEKVSWKDAQAFCKRLSELTGRSVRLPTEAEWEYACRAGASTRYCFGNGEEELSDYAWFDRNSGTKTHPVGTKRPNACGLHDMHGNVWEWCQDWYGAYGSPARVDPIGPASGKGHVLRGGAWRFNAHSLRCAVRYVSAPDGGRSHVGFRAALD